MRVHLNAVGYASIFKHVPANGLRPNLVDYAATCADFRWQNARAELAGLPDDRGLNIAHEAVDRHADGHARRQSNPAWSGANSNTELRGSWRLGRFALPVVDARHVAPRYPSRRHFAAHT